jgi:predicted HTH domain antitoxin
MTIELPDREVESLSLTPNRVRLELAIGLYVGRQVSLSRAAKIAGVAFADFMHEIGRRGICVNYTPEDAQHDLMMVDRLSGKTA